MTGSGFVSEAIKPVKGTYDTARMASGEPGMPHEFDWRKERFRVQKVIRTWKDTGTCRNGSTDRYIRKHWFEIVTVSGQAMTIYFERTPRRGSAAMSERWWLFSSD